MNLLKSLVLPIMALTVGFGAKGQTTKKPMIATTQLFSINKMPNQFVAALPDSVDVPVTDSTTKKVSLGKNQAMVLNFNKQGSGLTSAQYNYEVFDGDAVIYGDDADFVVPAGNLPRKGKVSMLKKEILNTDRPYLNRVSGITYKRN